jgi:hypothetical protein
VRAGRPSAPIVKMPWRPVKFSQDKGKGARKVLPFSGSKDSEFERSRE